MDTKSVIARFEAERQALAMMDHPGIARVYEAGATGAGRPWFTMEYVRGESLCEYCDRHRLDLRSRLDLFAKICYSVQHAHQKGVIHRDLKPGNILISVDARDEPQPKIIDFGIAKAVSQPLTDMTLHTSIGQVIGTLKYMAPEQLDMSGLDVDTRSDVYALGVNLYELLTGHTPFDTSTLHQIGMDEIKRTIREIDPPKPSTKLSTLSADETARIAQLRRSQPNDLSGTLRRELEWIPLKALMKDRTERYSSAESLARDIRRYLVGEALEAGPPTHAYRARKFIRRHRTALAMSCTFLLLLIVGIATTLVLWQQASEARRSAEDDRALTIKALEKAEQATQQAIDASHSLENELYLSQVSAAQRAVDWNGSEASELIRSAATQRPDNSHTLEIDLLRRTIAHRHIDEMTLSTGSGASAMSPDGTRIITGNGSIYDADSGDHLDQLELPLAPVSTKAIEFSDDGTLVHVVQKGAGSQHQHSLVFDLETPAEPIWTTDSGKVVFHPRTKSVLWGPTASSTTTFTSLSDGTERFHHPPVHMLAWSNDGQTIAVLQQLQAFPAIRMYRVDALFNNEEGTPDPTVTIEAGFGHLVSLVRCGKVGFTGQDRFLCATSSTGLLVFDANTGELLHTFGWPDDLIHLGDRGITLITSDSHVAYMVNNVFRVLDTESMSLLDPPQYSRAGDNVSIGSRQNWSGKHIWMSRAGSLIAVESQYHTHIYDLNDWADENAGSHIAMHMSLSGKHDVSFGDAERSILVSQGTVGTLYRRAKTRPTWYLEYVDHDAEDEHGLGLLPNACTTSTEGRHFIALGMDPDDDTIRCHVWDILTRERVLDTPLENAYNTMHHSHVVNITVNADCTHLTAILNGSLQDQELLGTWDLITGDQLDIDDDSAGENVWDWKHYLPQAGFYVHRDEYRLTGAAMDDEFLATWDLTDGSQVEEYPVGSGGVYFDFLGQNALGHPCAFSVLQTTREEMTIELRSWQATNQLPQLTKVSADGYATSFTVSEDGRLAVCTTIEDEDEDECTFNLLVFDTSGQTAPRTVRLELQDLG
ncbi:MAG: serine/threonine-protein kinase, partial [Phycisphaerales bacterium]|nr:serine/threonine-protein kinase [Phycisphaerales bacterium]